MKIRYLSLKLLIIKVPETKIMHPFEFGPPCINYDVTSIQEADILADKSLFRLPKFQ